MTGERDGDSAFAELFSFPTATAPDEPTKFACLRTAPRLGEHMMSAAVAAVAAAALVAATAGVALIVKSLFVKKEEEVSSKGKKSK